MKIQPLLTILLSLSISYSYAYQFKRLSVMGSSAPSPVIRSLLRGLSTLHIPHDFNNWSNPGDLVYVNSDISMLQRAISLKQRREITRLVAGPNLVIRPIDHQGLVGNNAIDMYLVNSDWTYTTYLEDMPKLRRSLEIWFAGIDETYWNEQKSPPNKNVLVYWKTESESFCKQVETALRSHDFNPIRLRYGSYNREQYKQLLNTVQFAVFISRTESQGIALLEAWAMNIPTLVWNPKELRAHGKQYSVVSACPYLSNATGTDWKHLHELTALLNNIETELKYFRPREWVLSHMTDTWSAQHMLNLIENMP